MVISKIVATGNDFLFLKGEDCQGLTADEKSLLVRVLCDRHFGIGADGLVVVDRMEKAPLWRWEFFNSDGSLAEMCGNATRCVGRWAKKNLDMVDFEFLTAKGVVSVDANGSEVVSKIRLKLKSPEEIHYLNGKEKKTAFAIDTGVPHAVVMVDDLSDQSKLLDHVPHLRHHAHFGARGANVTFVRLINPQEFETVTFERGVEGFTLSCGTGVLAAGWVGLRAMQRDPVGVSVQLKTPGGLLKVSYGNEDLKLSGPAKYLFDVVVDIESIIKNGAMG